MRYHDKRAHALGLMREHIEERIVEGVEARKVYAEVRSAMVSLLDQFRLDHDLPGTRYWEHPESDCFFSTEPGEELSDEYNLHCIELARHEFLSRQRIHFEDDAL